MLDAKRNLFIDLALVSLALNIDLFYLKYLTWLDRWQKKHWFSTRDVGIKNYLKYLTLKII